MTDTEKAARARRIYDLATMIWEDVKTTYSQKAEAIGCDDPQELALALSTCTADMYWSCGIAKELLQEEVGRIYDMRVAIDGTAEEKLARTREGTNTP